ncbi:MAG: lysylphosphatidylglycerol synthase transmembrane domain-containing protein [Bacteroidota bacterium]
MKHLQGRSLVNVKLFTPARIIFYLIAVFIFYLAVHYIDKLKDIKDLMLQMSPFWLLLTIGAQIGTYLLNAYIMRGLIHRHPGSTSLGSLFKMSIVIMFVNQALPTGGLSGNGYLFTQLTKRNVPKQIAFTALMLETVSYYVAILFLISLFYGWYYLLEINVKPVISYVVILGFVFYITLTIAVLALSNRRTVFFMLRKLSKYGWLKRYIKNAGLLSLQNEHQGSSEMLRKNRGTIVDTILLQLMIILCDVVTVFALVKGFHIHMSFVLIALALLLTLVIGALPISPGSLIIYESAMTYFFTTLGAPVHAALVITLLYRFFTFWLPIPIGLVLYRNLEGSRLPNKIDQLTESGPEFTLLKRQRR